MSKKREPSLPDFNIVDEPTSLTETPVVVRRGPSEKPTKKPESKPKEAPKTSPAKPKETPKAPTPKPKEPKPEEKSVNLEEVKRRDVWLKFNINNKLTPLDKRIEEVILQIADLVLIPKSIEKGLNLSFSQDDLSNWRLMNDPKSKGYRRRMKVGSPKP